MNASAKFSVIVIGTSAGGMDALKKLLSQFPADFAAPILVVNHMTAAVSGEMLIVTLNNVSKLKCLYPENGQRVEAGHVYIAPPDYHMLIEQGVIIITKGARENRYRPAIDPLFRSAAVAYGNRVIGIVLTGYLDDGTSGLIAIKRSGGICVVQSPKDAAYPGMPQSALDNLKIDHCVPISEMGSLLTKLLARKLGSKKKIPDDIVIEAKIAQRVLSDLPAVQALGEQVPFNCPECGGVLWKMAVGKFLRYRCHTGHAFTSAALIAVQTSKIEETLWVALRMFEERKNLFTTVSKQKTGVSSKLASQRAEESTVHINRIRAMLTSSNEKMREGVE